MTRPTRYVTNFNHAATVHFSEYLTIKRDLNKVTGLVVKFPEQFKSVVKRWGNSVMHTN